MKKIVGVLAIIVFALMSCKSQEDFNRTDNETTLASNDTIRIANDELEYEVIIIDPGFKGWLNARARKRGYYSKEFLENKNLQWVTAWNSRVNNPQQYGNLYLMRIDYQQRIDYGYEVNYLLYNYLLYFQIKNDQTFGGIVPQW